MMPGGLWVTVAALVVCAATPTLGLVAPAVRRPLDHSGRRRAIRVRGAPEKNEEDPPPDIPGAFEAGLKNGRRLVEERFVSPQIDDEGLVITDALLAGIVAPGLECIVAVLAGVPPPFWATRFGPGRLVLPVLFRGLNLATCWLGGAFAARCYARDCYDYPPPRGAEDRFAVTLNRVLQAGCFATALLVASTQFQILLQFGFPPPQLGDAEATDLELLRILDDAIRDIGTEALVLVSWRLVRTSLSNMD